MGDNLHGVLDPERVILDTAMNPQNQDIFIILSFQPLNGHIISNNKGYGVACVIQDFEEGRNNRRVLEERVNHKHLDANQAIR